MSYNRLFRLNMAQDITRNLYLLLNTMDTMTPG